MPTISTPGRIRKFLKTVTVWRALAILAFLFLVYQNYELGERIEWIDVKGDTSDIRDAVQDLENEVQQLRDRLYR